MVLTGIHEGENVIEVSFFFVGSWGFLLGPPLTSRYGSTLSGPILFLHPPTSAGQHLLHACYLTQEATSGFQWSPQKSLFPISKAEIFPASSQRKLILFIY